MVEQLGGLDAAFLYCETPTMHLHVCGLLLLDFSLSGLILVTFYYFQLVTFLSLFSYSSASVHPSIPLQPLVWTVP